MDRLLEPEGEELLPPSKTGKDTPLLSNDGVLREVLAVVTENARLREENAVRWCPNLTRGSSLSLRLLWRLRRAWCCLCFTRTPQLHNACAVLYPPVAPSQRLAQEAQEVSMRAKKLQHLLERGTLESKPAPPPTGAWSPSVISMVGLPAATVNAMVSRLDATLFLLRNSTLF
jgi:hypothetical protein